MAEIKMGVAFRLPQQFMTGFLAGALSPILVWLASFVEPIATSLIGAIKEALVGRAGVVTGTEIGTKLISILTGKFPGLPDILVAGIGGGVLVLLGTWMYNQKWSPNAIPGFKSTPITRMTLILFYASIAATLVLTSFALPPLQTFIVLAVNSIVTAWFIVNVIGKQLNLV